MKGAVDEAEEKLEHLVDVHGIRIKSDLVREAVRPLPREGADQIKIRASGGGTWANAAPRTSPAE